MDEEARNESGLAKYQAQQKLQTQQKPRRERKVPFERIPTKKKSHSSDRQKEYRRNTINTPQK
jgi:hypothetical protein